MIVNQPVNWTRRYINYGAGIFFLATCLAHFPGLTRAPYPHYEFLKSMVPPWIPLPSSFH
eukprot:CAMPEP_0174942584 /NCGR_PEP_ID=MMETSP1355-20121228/74656_1 /TAXON_ID=464990 /ORGANISM="Hemiselmis tepida, Strain CCMP443" /LENGTH=59 /DNA_ID=CAMNT_0016189763 /DNA_START=67 /DNA_END=243 /DNA_ORIENTATION=-